MIAARPTSLTAAFPGRRFARGQWNLLARLWNGEDVRAWACHPTTVLTLLERGVIDCAAATCRLTLLLPAEVAAHRAALAADIRRLEGEIDAVAAALDAATPLLRRAHLRVALEESNVHQLIRDVGLLDPRRAARDLATARAALDDARAGAWAASPPPPATTRTPDAHLPHLASHPAPRLGVPHPRHAAGRPVDAGGAAVPPPPPGGADRLGLRHVRRAPTPFSHLD